MVFPKLKLEKIVFLASQIYRFLLESCEFKATKGFPSLTGAKHLIRHITEAPVIFARDQIKKSLERVILL